MEYRAAAAANERVNGVTMFEVTPTGTDVIELRLVRVSGTAAQKAEADAILDQARRGSWPPDLVSVSVFTTVGPVSSVGFLAGALVDDPQPDDLAVITYTHWRRGHRAGEREYQLLASHRPAGAVTSEAAAMILVDFDGPDANRQHQWIDAVLAALRAEPEPTPGLVAAHFHASADGTGVLNYAQWTSLDAYAQALERGPGGIAQTDLPEWRTVREMPGVRRNRVARCVLHGAVAASAPVGGQ